MGDEILKTLSFVDVFGAGFSLLVTIVILMAVTVEIMEDFLYTMIGNNIDTAQTLTDLHTLLFSSRSRVLICVAFFWLSVPFAISHIYFFKRVMESLFSSIIDPNITTVQINISCLKWIYILTFAIGMVLIQCFGGIFLFLASYYDWEISDDSNESISGEYIQLLLVRAFWSVVTCAIWLYCIAGSIPWIVILFTSDHARLKLFGCNYRCSKKFINVLLVLTIVLMYFGTLCTMEQGWTYFAFTFIASFVIVSLWLMLISCQMEIINDLIVNFNSDNEYAKVGIPGNHADDMVS